MTRPHETDADRAAAYDDVMTAPGGVVVGLLSTGEQIDDLGTIRYTSSRAEFHCNNSDAIAAAVASKQVVSIVAKTETANYRITNIEIDDAGGAIVFLHRE